MPVSAAQERAGFLADGREMGALIGDFDWESTSIGPSDGWPQSLRTTIRLMLTNNHPMLIWWGRDLIQFYNDALRRRLAPERHPSALGQPAREYWGEIWQLLAPQVELVMSGRGVIWNADQPLLLARPGSPQQSWWNYGFGPIPDDGGVGGVIVLCNDVTEQHLAARALRETEQRLARISFNLEEQIGLLARARHRLPRLSSEILFAIILNGS